jgi:hypothetical protein
MWPVFILKGEIMPTTESGQPKSDDLDAKETVEEGLGDQQTSGDGDGQTEVDLQELLGTVKSMQSTLKTLQSGKDRAVDQALKASETTQGEVENLKGQIEQIINLREKGLDAEGIAEELGKVSVEDRLERIERLLLGQSKDGTGSSPTDEQARVISEVGLKEDDPAVIEAIREGLTGSDLKAELAIAALEKANKPSPGPSSNPPKGSGQAGGTEKYDVSEIDDSDELYKIAAEKEFGG